MPWVPIKNFDEDVRVGDLIKTKSGLRACVEALKEGEVVLRKVTAFNESLDSVWREPKRWRAENGERYCFLEAGIRPGISIREANEAYLPVNSADYECGNYFKPGFLKEKHIQAFKDLLAKFHEEEE